MDANTILNVTETLIGKIHPCGDSGEDHERMNNLGSMIYVIDWLLDEVRAAALCKDCQEGSMRDIGQRADKALRDWRGWLDGFYGKDGEE